MALSTDHLSPAPITPLPAFTLARQELTRMLVGTTLQPGLYGLLAHTGKLLTICPEDHVLFLAPEPVEGALLLAQTFGCHVEAIIIRPALHYYANTVARGHRKLADSHYHDRVILNVVPIEELGAHPDRADVVITEGAFALASDKAAAASALYSVLRPCGRLALAEPTLYAELVPEELRHFFLQLPFLAGARPAPVYRSMLGESGLTAFVTEERRQDLVRAVEAVLTRLELADDPELARPPGSTADDDVSASLEIARRVLELIKQGGASYVLISAEKP